MKNRLSNMCNIQPYGSEIVEKVEINLKTRIEMCIQLLIQHNFYGIEKNQRLYNDVRRKCCNIFVSHAKKKRNPAASHIFICTLFHFNKDLSKIILAVCPIDNWLLRIKLIIKANYLVAEPIWLVPLRFICEVIITVWPTTTYWFSTSLKVSINHEGYSY